MLVNKLGADVLLLLCRLRFCNSSLFNQIFPGENIWHITRNVLEADWLILKIGCKS